MKYSINDVAKMIDHTNLSPNATYDDLRMLCNEAVEYDFAMVAINSVHTLFCNRILKNSSINTGAAISFPLGQTTVEVKKMETINAIYNGADEIDYVINLTEVKEGNYKYIENEMQQIINICKQHDVISKVIFENAYLTKDEIIRLSKIAKRVNPHYIKTSTGFALTGAKVEDVKLMKKYVGERVKVKAAGGIRSLEDLVEMIKSGADRIGTSSGTKIINELKEYFIKENVDYLKI